MLQRLRSLLRWIFTFVFVAITVAMVAEFFIEFAKEKGWYEKPSQRLEAVMTAFSQTWVLVTVAFLGGITIGLWADYLLRRWEAIAAGQKALVAVETSPADAELTTKGILDFIIDGLEAIKDIRIIIEQATTSLSGIQRTTVRYQWLLNLAIAQNFRLRRKLIARFSAKLNKHSENVRQQAKKMSDANKRVQDNCIGFIGYVIIASQDDFNSLIGFASTIKGSINTYDSVVAIMEETQKSTGHLMGASRELNAAAILLATSIGEMLTELKAHGDVLEQIDAALDKKRDGVEALFASSA